MVRDGVQKEGLERDSQREVEPTGPEELNKQGAVVSTALALTIL